MKRTIPVIFIIFLFSMISCVTDDDPDCDINNPCEDGFVCVDGECVENIIETEDDDDNGLPVETPDETNDEIKVPDDFEWSDDSEQLCEPNELLFCDPDDIYNIVRCNSTGDDIESVPCGEMTVCQNGKCEQQICVPGEPFCNEDDLSKVFECNEYGTGTTIEVAEDCGQGGFCQKDKCIFYCDIAAEQRSYQGCDYFTAHLNTSTMRSDPIYALTISNPYSDKIVTVEITNFTESGEVDAGKNFFCIDDDTACMSMTSSEELIIHPGKLGIVQFPHEKMIKETGQKWNSYRIKTDLPVTVYQFSPFDNSFNNPFEENGKSVDYNFLAPEYGKSYSNDASLLIPAASVYTDYIAAAHGSPTATTYITIIGISEKDTKISIKPSVAVSAANGIPSIASGAVGTITLKTGQVAQIEETGKDLTGTRIYCDSEEEDCAPFAVFSGTDCANIPNGYGYCDHVEQQLFPVQTWGQNYILVKSNAREEEWDYVRIIASENDTTLSFSPDTPEQISVPSGWRDFTVNPVQTEINEGEYSEFYFKGTLVVESDKPVMVVQYLAGADMLSETCQTDHTDDCVGDPAMMLIPPVEQFRKDYLFLTPGSYKSNYATIVMNTGETPVLNDKEVDGIEEISGTEFSYVIVDLGNEFKTHTLECSDNPCGLFVYGWEQDVSYAYPGGLDFELLSQN